MLFFNMISLLLCFIDLEIKNITQKYNTDATVCNFPFFKFRIKYCINKGVMYGMHNNLSPRKLINISLISLGLLIFFYSYRIYEIIPIIIGSLFNIYDRFIQGYVRDYLYMEIFGFKTNIFNLPDFLILLNMVYILIY